MQRVLRWIGFMNLPEFAEMDFYTAKTRIERGTNLMKQMEEIQLDTMRAVVLARLPIADYGNEFMDLEEQYFTASTRLLRRFVEVTPGNEQHGAAAPAQGVEQQPLVVKVPPQQHNIPNSWGYFDGKSLTKWKDF